MIKKVCYNPSSFPSAADFHAHIFHVYAKLLRALCKISSFSSLIPTLVHALMTLKAKGCFFRHNRSPAVSQFPRSRSVFSHLITFVHPFYGYWGAGRRGRGEVSDLTVVTAMSPNVYWKRASNNF